MIRLYKTDYLYRVNRNRWSVLNRGFYGLFVVPQVFYPDGFSFALR